jgi:hypothetical protein
MEQLSDDSALYKELGQISMDDVHKFGLSEKEVCNYYYLYI